MQYISCRLAIINTGVDAITAKADTEQRRRTEKTEKDRGTDIQMDRVDTWTDRRDRQRDGESRHRDGQKRQNRYRGGQKRRTEKTDKATDRRQTEGCTERYKDRGNASLHRW